jgi:hypothetical protein
VNAVSDDVNVMLSESFIKKGNWEKNISGRDGRVQKGILFPFFYPQSLLTTGGLELFLVACAPAIYHFWGLFCCGFFFLHLFFTLLACFVTHQPGNFHLEGN